jgi:recombination DNA repair RAD52 pathway protein
MENKNNELALVTVDDLTFSEANVLNQQQLQKLLSVTPKQYVKKRPAKGGGEWEYVTGGYIRKVLNLMFGWDWDFEILDEKIMHGEAIVKGRLTCRSAGKTIIKTQYGNKDIILRKADEKGERHPLSIGNDLKAAATDCLKKCAAEIGIAADIYNKEDFKAVKVKPTESEIIDQKEVKKISDFINTAPSLEALEESEPFVDDVGLRDFYELKKLQLCK